MNEDLNEVVCRCWNVTAGDIKKAVDNGAQSYESVRDATRASTGCGGCEGRVRELVEKFLHPE